MLMPQRFDNITVIWVLIYMYNPVSWIYIFLELMQFRSRASTSQMEGDLAPDLAKSRMHDI